MGTTNHEIMGSSPAWDTGDDNGASVHSPVNKYLAIDSCTGSCTHGALKSIRGVLTSIQLCDYYKRLGLIFLIVTICSSPNDFEMC